MCVECEVKGARIFGRRGYPGLLDMATEGTVIFNNVEKLNKALGPLLCKLAVNGTYWSKARRLDYCFEWNLLCNA